MCTTTRQKRATDTGARLEGKLVVGELINYTVDELLRETVEVRVGKGPGIQNYESTAVRERRRELT